MSKISMMFKIVALLQTSYMLTKSELARILETTPRNIKAYIDGLRMAGVPIEGISGKRGGYFLSKTYEFKPPKLDELEISAILLAEEVLTKENGFLYENEIKTGFAKIKAAQGEIMGKSDNIAQEHFIFSKGKVDINSAIKERLSTIRKAILDKKRIKITYTNPIKKQTTTRVVDPYNLLYQDNSWYIVGYCHLRSEIRIFKLTRIRDINFLDETYHIPRGYSVTSYMRNTFSIIREKEYTVEIQFFHPASVWVSEKLWLPSQKIVWLKNDSIIFKARVDGLKDIKRWVLGYGKLAKVLKPDKLVQEVKEEAEGIAKLYEEKTN